MNRNIDVEAIASKVKTHMMGDIRRELIKLFEKSGVEAHTLSRDLHISVNDINAVMNQDASSLTLDAFIKLLIATGNALEVKPVFGTNKMPMRDARGRFIPTPKMPCFGGEKRNFDNPFHVDINPINDVKPRPWERPATDTTSFMTDLVGMNKQQLMGVIMSKHWDNEIDIHNASRGELIDFIVHKRQNTVTPSSVRNEREVFEPSFNDSKTSCENTESTMDFDCLIDAFKEFVKNNPSIIPSKL